MRQKRRASLLGGSRSATNVAWSTATYVNPNVAFLVHLMSLFTVCIWYVRDGSAIPHRFQTFLWIEVYPCYRNDGYISIVPKMMALIIIMHWNATKLAGPYQMIPFVRGKLCVDHTFFYSVCGDKATQIKELCRLWCFPPFVQQLCANHIFSTVWV